MEFKLSVLDELKFHLQIAIQVELSTIPIYLYTYYSINRRPEKCDQYGPPNDYMIATFANKAGGTIMSVAIEEMLHMSLASNILRAVGGTPKIYGLSPQSFPTNLLEHRPGPLFDLAKLSVYQLNQFLLIEKPEAKDAPPESDNWDTLGQFYDYILTLVEKLQDSDFQHGDSYQLSDKKGSGTTGYYVSSNVDTIYPDNAVAFTKPIEKNNPIQPLESSAHYSNQDDSGNLMVINSKASAKAAITMIKDQGEGYNHDDTHKPDDPSKKEDSHWYKFNSLLTQSQNFTADEWNCFLFQFPNNPKRANTPAEYVCVVDLVNAVYSYLLKITEVSYTLTGNAQYAMFYIGMHKGMIFILDKLIGNMRYTAISPDGTVLAPTFENFPFQTDDPKQELLALCDTVSARYPGICDANIAQRIYDLPDVNIKYTPEGVAIVNF
ncbi:MAG: ferritin-like protein [Phycisphaerae bacterium]|nr:ferritin-like protein [Saprospiraceae bacterium]